MPRIKTKETRNPGISKRLQTEFQSLIAFACYDSDSVLKAGKSAKRLTIVTKIAEKYMPSNSCNGDRMSFVDLFLEGKGRFKHLFVEKTTQSDTESSTATSTNHSPTPSVLMIPSFLHCNPGHELVVRNGCIDKSLLTRKNLSNPVDIQAMTLYRHAKEVEMNCKKALAFCLGEDSPYRNWNGTYPSGTNWEDYLIWVRTKMYHSSLDTTAIVEVVDEESNEDGNADGNEDGNDEDGNVLDEDEDEEEASENGGGNCILQEPVNNDAGNVEDPVEDPDEVGTAHEDELPSLPPDEIFKGFLAFALWGFITPEGGDQYKSTLMATVVDTETKPKKENGRKAVKIAEGIDKDAARILDVRGDSISAKKQAEQMLALTGIMIDGRTELKKMQLYKVRIGKLELELKYHASRINELKEEVKELKEDGYLEDDETKIDLKELKGELKRLKELRNSTFQNLNIVMGAEVERRAMGERNETTNDSSMETSTSSLKRKRQNHSHSSDVPEQIGFTQGTTSSSDSQSFIS